MKDVESNQNRPGMFELWFGLRGRQVLVTGASRGIGRCLAESLGQAGAHVCVHYHRSGDLADEVVTAINGKDADGHSWKCQADLSKPVEVKRLFSEIEKRWGGLDVLVNNAGDLIERRRIDAMGDGLIEAVIQTNLHSVVYASREAIPMLQKRKGASIINVSSVAAHNGGANGVTLYAACKGAVLSMTRGLAKELAPDVRVNAIAPGVILTDFHRTHSTEEALDNVVKSTPMKRLGLPEDHAAAVVFLAGGGSSYITGEMIEINGGLWVA